jgi:hypothetical protein
MGYFIASGLGLSFIIASGLGLSFIIASGLGLSFIIASGVAVSFIIASGVAVSFIIASGVPLAPGCVHPARPMASPIAPIATNPDSFRGDRCISSSGFGLDRPKDRRFP